MQNNEINSSEQISTQAHVESPHIPKIQGEYIYGILTNTILTSVIFLFFVIVFSFFANKALKSKKSKFKSAILNILWFFDKYLIEHFSDKKFARSFFPLIIWIFFIIFFANIFWLIIDWLGSVFPIIFIYLRPINSDLNTTLVLAVLVVISSLFIAIKSHWGLHVSKSYFFNFEWKNTAEKFVNLFVGRLHLIWIPTRLASLSLRLFWNIFAWVILIWVITFLWVFVSNSIWIFEVWRFFSIPFWLFEVFVAFIQSIVFFGLMLAYFSEGKDKH